jgi:small multidrug resistance pump
VVAAFSQVLLKKSASKEHKSFLREYLNPEVIIGYGMLVGSTILTILAFRRIEYKNGPIIESLGYIFIMILSLCFFKEKITKKKLIGNALILLGIFIYYC